MHSGLLLCKVGSVYVLPSGKDVRWSSFYRDITGLCPHCHSSVNMVSAVIIMTVMYIKLLLLYFN
jgi:hypothetical protein